MTAYDELELDTLGDRKTALFLIMSDTEDSMNFLIAMAYSQLFNLLCEKADDVYGGRLPVHVRCLIDEAANIGQIPRLEKLVATIRSREVSACLVLQAQSQLKAIYKDNADTIIGNMDATVFLPFFLLAMYEKNGQPLEKILRNMIRVCFLRPRQRPYKTKNFYAVVMRQDQLDREVYHIVNGKAKTDSRREKADRGRHRQGEPDR